MNEQEIIQKAITELNSALPGYVAVRTGGGDSGAGPPLCILNWDSTRLNENGQNSLGRIVRDSAGDAIGREFHQYRRMELDVVIRAYDEGDRDTWLSDVAEYFLPYEYDADLFHSDTTEWEVGDAEPRSNPVVEPDWYEGGLVIRFRYVSRAVRFYDALTSVQESVEANDN